MMNTETDTSFAQACYDQNTLDELRAILAGEPDQIDMKTWGLTAEQWREEIEIAIGMLEDDARAQREYEAELRAEAVQDRS